MLTTILEWTATDTTNSLSIGTYFAPDFIPMVVFLMSVAFGSAMVLFLINLLKR